MNKIKLVVSALLSLSSFTSVFAGGILTNTNQSARFARLMALEASTSGADIAYYNPAGTIKLSEGFHFTFSNQSAFQKRIINASSPFFAGSIDQQLNKEYIGTASAPIIPSLQGVYRKGQWALSGSIAVTGGGGKATFNNGLPMFEMGAAQVPMLISKLTNGAMQPTRYAIDQYMEGSNFIYGAQLGGAYEINKMFSVYGGFRLSIVNNKYEGYLRNLQTDLGGVMTSPSAIFNNAISAMEQASASQADINNLYLLSKAGSAEGANLNSKQSGWGIAPIIGFNFSYDKLNIGAKYEFKTSLNVENKTKIDDTGKNGTGMFGDGVNSDHDVPALFTIGAEYKILPQLSLAVGYHHFFDKDAQMDKGKQKKLEGDTNEYLFGAEYKINKMFLVSAGAQITRYGMGDDFQSDLSFSVNSYSLGCGGAVNVSKSVQINVGYFYTDYSDYNIETSSINKTYTRKNKVFTAGIDISF
ncbi:outer membrane beta-barrel protein [Dysgonomonas sp. Marseille-P4677]|uniref:OmpP1/FadL family transporter n=1 Tax=Dysgonomonas sp. Marseille-P4677 TaxID=2364790 RepID=UPI001911E953|nr:outer membrane beta-barrel protein [Dysgonomonas sp. Marseille-P4677]MBK5719254.1 outer membrane beta-barrel protein [Dysgonomonas sp. Marseille-P4677]